MQFRLLIHKLIYEQKRQNSEKWENKIFYINNFITAQFLQIFYMGLTQSLQKISSFESYHSLIQRYPKSIYFNSQLEIYKNKFNLKQQFSKHTVKFDNINEMKHYVQQIKSIIQNKANHSPFNILYPINVFLKDENSLIDNIRTSCSQKTNQAIIIHKWLGKSLQDFVKEKNGALNQKLIWFIVNELSKSLQILQEKNHASHHLTPQNIWYNQNQNWFLYDGYFVLGNQYIQDFYKKKVKLKQFTSQEFKKKVQSNGIITNYQAIQQDIFCLGYCIIFMMTSVHPKQMPQKQSQRDKYTNDLLQALTEISSQTLGTLGTQTQRLEMLQKELKIHKYSSQLITFVRNLIKLDPKRRFSIRHIRSYLKTKQQQIFLNEQQQWSRTTIDKGDSPTNDNKNTSSKFRNINYVKSPQRPYQTKLFTQNSQGNNQRNMTSMRTLKKQQVPQKIIMMNNKNLSKFPLSLNENQQNKYFQLHEGQSTPIRKIDEFKSRNFIDQRKISNATFQADNFIKDPQQNTLKYSNLKKMSSPGKQQSYTVFVSPKKFNTASVNAPSVFANLNQNSQNHSTNNQISSQNHIFMQSPPHQQVFQSPVKVKLNYFSPQKSYF